MDLEKITMVAKRGLSESEKITPLMEPLASCLLHSRLSTHCSACFCAIDNSMSEVKAGLVTYCSAKCAAVDSPIYYSSGEHELFRVLQTQPQLWVPDHYTCNDISFLRLALRLILLLPPPPPGPLSYATPPYIPFPLRILGLSCNDPGYFYWVDSGAYAMANARAIQSNSPFYHPPCLELERKALTLVISNALRVSLDDNTFNPIGIALYDYRISWLNHSCAPNSHVKFVHAFQPMPADQDQDQDQDDEDIDLPVEPQILNGSFDWLVGLSAPCTVSQLLNGSGPRIVSELRNDRLSYGPRAAVQTLIGVRQGEEMTISYIDASLSSVELRNNILQKNYKFTCNCRRCYWTVSEGEDDDSDSCSRGEQVATILQHLELAQGIVPEGSKFSPSNDRDGVKLEKPMSQSARWIKSMTVGLLPKKKSLSRSQSSSAHSFRNNKLNPFRSRKAYEIK